MPNKNPNPKVISSSDARIEGQLQIEDVIVLEQLAGGDPIIINADGPALSINGAEAFVLDESGLVPADKLPQVGLVGVTVVADEEEQLALTAQEGDVAVRSDIEVAFMHNGGDAGTMADWTQLSFIYVSSVAGKTGAVSLELADIDDWDAADYAAASHTHAVADISDFDPADKADAVHTHGVADITDLNSRQTLTQTVTVAAGAEVSVDLPLAKAFGLWKLTTDKEARVRIYSTSADRTADTSRAEGTAPAAGTGLITEVITTSSLLSVPLTPPQFGASLESTPSANISALVKNKAATADVTITLTWTPFG